MEFQDFILFFIVSLITVSSPGPGVIFSLNNAIRHGFSYAVPGFLGLALGTLIISFAAASGVGALISAHPLVFAILKYIGAAYLVYLGVKLWRTKMAGVSLSNDKGGKDSAVALFRKGVLITLFNPKLMVFFIALFPQFFKPDVNFLMQLSLYSFIFCSVLLLVHFIYCFFSAKVGEKLATPRRFKLLNRISGSIFFGFAAGLLLAD